jgi:hypothetical protein
MSARYFSIWIVSPPGYVHSRCFEEVALGLRDAFAVLGFDAPIVTDPSLVRDYAVVLGANLLFTIPKQSLPKRCILYNLEQIQLGSPWLRPETLEVMRHCPVWDYSTRNIEKFREFHVYNVSLCGIGYAPALTRIPSTKQDIDIAFVGSMNKRREAVLRQLASLGKKVAVGFEIYGSERDAIFARSKVVLNMHFYEAQVFEVVRVSYLLANRKCVVSETGSDAALESPLKDGIAFAPYDGLVSTCIRLIDNEAERTALAERGFNCFSAMSQAPMLERALASLPTA